MIVRSMNVMGPDGRAFAAHQLGGQHAGLRVDAAYYKAAPSRAVLNPVPASYPEVGAPAAPTE
jgi:hypothetical protein